jgi:N-acetylglucosamine kinase-like BadF-type ATPase
MDRRRKPGLLGKRICEKLGVTSPKELPGALYREETPDIASLSEVVAAVAQEGDEDASRILERAGLELARLALSVIRKLNLEKGDLRVSYVGSVFKSDFVLRPFGKLILRAAPGALVRPPIHSPAVGAIQLAKVLPSGGTMEGFANSPRPLVCSFLEDRWVEK